MDVVNDGGHRQQRRVVDDVRVAALCLDQAPEPVKPSATAQCVSSSFLSRLNVCGSA